MKPILILCLCAYLLPWSAYGQGQPWNHPLQMAWSPDGIHFQPSTVFQDSAGVPSLIRWKGDTLIAAFQWFRLPNPSPGWDRVAVKYSYDLGLSWTPPEPILLNGLPGGFQRPFDPALAVFGTDSLRIYFSSGIGPLQPGQDSAINTYSASSADGLHFQFEPGARVDRSDSRVIDPAVVYFNQAWHYLAPAGSPQMGAWHYVSPDGLHFSPVPDIPSDNQHNWTGNYLAVSPSELRFYGSGPELWFNSSPNGGQWNGYVSTQVQGGDPAVVQTAPDSFLMIYTGPAYPTGMGHVPVASGSLRVFPNPSSGLLYVQALPDGSADSYCLYDALGRMVCCGALKSPVTTIDLQALPSGVYWLQCGAQRTGCRVVRP